MGFAVGRRDSGTSRRWLHLYAQLCAKNEYFACYPSRALCNQGKELASADRKNPVVESSAIRAIREGMQIVVARPGMGGHRRLAAERPVGSVVGGLLLAGFPSLDHDLQPIQPLRLAARGLASSPPSQSGRTCPTS